ncbi:MAG: efflux RND transporter periplasmic adaptor subunit [Bacteroidales bacterium]|nr:efflux RND transporter periplasmic adaptor subunit [Bacteroidales bacterium]
MKKIPTEIPFIFSAMLLAVFFLSSCGNKNQSQKHNRQITSVGVATAVYASAPEYFEYPSTLVANKKIDLRADVGGRVEAILFKEGGHVTKGQAMYTIDKRLYLAKYNQARAQLRIAETNYVTDTTDARRYQNLWAHNAVDKIQLDHALAQVQVAKANVASAKANMIYAQTNLDQATVKAPFSGTTNVSDVRLGDLVVASQTPLVTVVDNSNMNADFYINEANYVKLGENDRSIREKLSHFRLFLPDGREYKYKGSLDFVDNTVDPTTGTILVRLRFPNPGHVLKSGMNCVVRLTQKNEKALVIPQDAIQQLLDEYFVYVVNDKGIVEQAKVNLGAVSGTLQIIKSGLKPGQKVIVEGIENVRPQEKVKAVSQEGKMAGN